MKVDNLVALQILCTQKPFSPDDEKGYVCATVTCAVETR